jgi:hypothetical protein
LRLSLGLWCRVGLGLPVVAEIEDPRGGSLANGGGERDGGGVQVPRVPPELAGPS